MAKLYLCVVHLYSSGKNHNPLLKQKVRREEPNVCVCVFFNRMMFCFPFALLKTLLNRRRKNVCSIKNITDSSSSQEKNTYIWAKNKRSFVGVKIQKVTNCISCPKKKRKTS